MLADIIVIAIIALIAGLCIRKLVKGKKNGGCDGCGGNCSGCGTPCHTTDQQTTVTKRNSTK